MTSRYGDLAALLGQIAAHDTDYGLRYELVLRALLEARSVGLSAGLGYDEAPTATPGFRIVAYIDLPTGQVSWHMPEYPGRWDGHSTTDKYSRIRALAEQIADIHAIPVVS